MPTSARVYEMGQNQASSRGFSLIEVTIGLLILGILMVPAISVYEKYRQDHIRAASQDYPRAVAGALRKYALLYGRYPRPADPNVAATAPAFGTEIPLSGSYPNCTSTSTTVCQTAGATQGIFSSRILIGTVPFADIGLPREMSFDGYGRRFTYAVTQSLTLANAFNASTADSSGVIRVNTGIPADNPATAGDDRFPLGVTTNNIHFVIVSHGENGAGAFVQAAGTRFAPCPGGGFAFERENCNNNTTFQEHMEIFNETDPVTGTVTSVRKKTRNLANTASYFDDTIAFSTTIAGSDWTRIAADSDVVSRTGGMIQIGTDPSAPLLPEATVDVYGNIRANTLQTRELCDESAGCTNTFTPALIGGTPDPVTSNGSSSYAAEGINCGDQSMSGIQNANERCSTGAAPSLSAINCPTGTALKGIGAGGTPLCVSF